ncbi:DUF4442 domain-containing protein [Fulvivirga sp. 29W222]|uniref:DUF4442 domain-containing protein n=1 Tax=Fulvivirga marina TaxID=2494733 RepID=A0A937FW40_9BACT|nr:DUF4442 domain-containing protein [Fulvivirga marina]MBL6447220.1 DUF4442 domain-containing protein [Fulvivirga marina]
MDTKKIVERAKSSKFYMWLLNMGLERMIPFNKPHGFKVEEIKDDYIKTSLPYKKRNFNHIRGLHACALATLSEFTTGFLMVSRLDPKKYRIILKTLEMDYHYQGKMRAYGTFTLTEDWLNDQIYKPLEANEAVVVICEIKIHDEEGNHLTTGKVHWQVKSWSKVRTKA